MSLTISQMRSLVRRGLGDLTTADMPDSEVDEYLSMALWELDNQYDFREKECIVEFDLVSGQRQYSLTADVDALLGVSVRDEQQWHRLDRMSEDWYTDEYNEDTEEQDLPEKYMRVEDVVLLYPTPDEAYRAQIFQLKELASETDLPRNWHEILVDEAIVKGLKYSGDINQAQQYANFPLQARRQSVLNRTKEEEDSENAGLRVRREGIGNWR